MKMKRTTHGQQGKGFLSFFKKVGKFIKDNKVISTVANLIPLPGAQVIGKVSGAVGLGRKRKTKARAKTKQTGGARKGRKAPTVLKGY